MGHTRVIYTDSTTAECSTVLKMFNFEEDTRNGYFIQPDDGTVKAYVLWGRSSYYPDLEKSLGFAPRVQIHFKTRDKVDSLDFYTREAVVALKNLDPNSRIQVYDADARMELSF